MRVALIAALMAPASLLAERVACSLSAPCPGGAVCAPEPATLSFEIDHNQFAPPIDAREPPRRKVTTVWMDGASFEAEPILMQGRRGFWAEREDGSHLLTVEADGSAIYSRMPGGGKLSGTCMVSN